MIGSRTLGVLRVVAPFPGAALVCCALGLANVRPALAASDEEKAGARAAATQGQAAFDAKHWAEALDLFTRAESLVHSPVHLLYKARALVQLGQLVKARESYLSISRDDAASASPAVAKAREAAAKEEAALGPRLANLTVKLDGPGAADAIVTMDGVTVPTALVGLARPADPGQHTLQAKGSTTQSEAQSVTLKEGGAASVTLQLKPIPGGAPIPVLPPVAEPVSAPATPAGGLDAGASSPNANTLRTVSYVALGVGAIGLAAGTLFGLSAKGKYSDGNALCKDQDPCTLSQSDANRREQLGKDGDSAKTLSIVGFIAGGVGVAAGATLFILSNKKTSESARAEVHPWLGLGSVGLSGRF